MEERVRTIMIELNQNHRKYMNERISGIFSFGFVMGLIFSYTGILGFISGIIVGIVLARKFPDDALETTQITTNVFYNAFMQARTYINDIGNRKN